MARLQGLVKTSVVHPGTARERAPQEPAWDHGTRTTRQASVGRHRRSRKPADPHAALVNYTAGDRLVLSPMRRTRPGDALGIRGRGRRGRVPGLDHSPPEKVGRRASTAGTLLSAKPAVRPPIDPEWSEGQAATPSRSRPWRLSCRSEASGARRGHRRHRGHTSPATARPGGCRVREVHGCRALGAGRAPLVPTRVAVTPGPRMIGVGARASPPMARLFTTSPLDWMRVQGAELCQTNYDNRIQEIMTRKSCVG
jgi:hypothetical protein